MNGDIKLPPVRSRAEKTPTATTHAPIAGDEPALPAPMPIDDTLPPPKRRRWLRIIAIAAVTLLIVAIVAGLAGWAWFRQQLQAVQPGSTETILVKVVPGTDVDGLASQLSDAGMLRNAQVFEWYVRWEGAAGKLQAGTFRLSKGDDVPAIVSMITGGRTETFTVTFLPGNTLAKHRKALETAGYSATEIDAAFAKSYDHPIFATKPKNADLEGYIYGETYQFPADATVEDILTRTFDEFYKVVESEKLISGYQKYGLSLFEGITLASIIQREVPTAADQKQVSQVFHLRLKRDMQLGSDVTYQYIADKTGVPRDPGLDSPYNTRRYEGLTPGPIASPGKSALIATAQPAKGNYVYFLSGDDDKTYFARTNEQHEQNIVDHCKKKCQIL